MSEERITKYTIGSCTIDVCYDELLEDMESSSESDIIEDISDCYYWMIALPWINATDAAKTKFFDKFKDANAVTARKVAIWSSAVAKNEKELELINQACRLSERMKKDGSYNMKMASVLGIQIIELIESRNTKSFTRIAEILKVGGVKEGKQGGLESNQGKLLESFIELHRQDPSKLPTKKDIRELAGILPYADLVSDADKDLKKIGLSGLPPS